MTAAKAATEARRVHPEVVKVYLFGSLVKGNWTADSDADLIVIVPQKDFPTLSEAAAPTRFSPLRSRQTLWFIPSANSSNFELTPTAS